jgi:8-oxo-dGTP diphosphatase
MSKRIHVAAGIIFDAAQNILIARRPDHLHQGGLWEFPGGKVEAQEDVFFALRRELKEELGIEIVEGRHYSTICHDYPDKHVLLEFWLVERFSGDARGCEGQLVEWVPLSQLGNYEFPVANRPVIEMLLDTGSD